MADLFAILDDGAASAAPLLVCELPGAPRGKGRHRSRIVYPKGGKAFIHNYPDPETVQYERALEWKAKAAMRGRKPFEGPLAIRVFVMIAIPKSWSKRDRNAALVGTLYPTSRPDWDNYAKVCCDAFNEIVWLDDAQVVRALTVKEYAEHPGMIVEVYSVP